MMASTKIAQIVSLRQIKGLLELHSAEKRGCQSSRYLQTTFAPEPLVQIKNYFTEMFLMLPSTKIDQKVQFG